MVINTLKKGVKELGFNTFVAISLLAFGSKVYSDLSAQLEANRADFKELIQASTAATIEQNEKIDRLIHILEHERCNTNETK